MRPLKLMPEEEKMTLEELAVHWTKRSKEMGREDRWDVVDGFFVKVHWEGKEEGTPPYRYITIDGTLYHPKPFDER